MKCPSRGCTNEARVDKKYGVIVCLPCEDKEKVTRLSTPEFLTNTKETRIKDQRDRFAKDIEQPYIGDKMNPAFVRAYPDKAKDHFTEAELKSL